MPPLVTWVVPFSPLTGNNGDCIHCLPLGTPRPNATQFTNNLAHFLRDNPSINCAAAGHAAYASAVVHNGSTIGGKFLYILPLIYLPNVTILIIKLLISSLAFL